MQKFILMIGIVLSLLTVSLNSWSDNANDQAAKEAFTRGKKAFKALKYSEAADAFRKAYDLKPSWKLLYNIGQAEASAKHYGLALEAFEQYLAQGGDDISVERRDTVFAELQRLRLIVGSVEIRAPKGARVFVDDVERGKTPLPGTLKVAAGIVHTVRVELEGMEFTPRTVQVSGGDESSLEFKPESEPEAEQKPEPEPQPAPPTTTESAPEEMQPAAESPKSPLKIWGWVTLGVGGALLAGGGITGGLALASNGDLEDECTADGDCPPDMHDKIDTRDKLAMTTNVLLGVGAAAAVTGAVLLIVDAVSGEENASDVALVPSVGTGVAGAAIVGRF